MVLIGGRSAQEGGLIEVRRSSLTHHALVIDLGCQLGRGLPLHLLWIHRRIIAMLLLSSCLKDLAWIQELLMVLMMIVLLLEH